LRGAASTGVTCTTVGQSGIPGRPTRRTRQVDTGAGTVPAVNSFQQGVQIHAHRVLLTALRCRSAVLPDMQACIATRMNATEALSPGVEDAVQTAERPSKRASTGPRGTVWLRGGKHVKCKGRRPRGTALEDELLDTRRRGVGRGRGSLPAALPCTAYASPPPRPRDSGTAARADSTEAKHSPTATAGRQRGTEERLASARC
jgi:hypothetical protein